MKICDYTSNQIEYLVRIAVHNVLGDFRSLDIICDHLFFDDDEVIGMTNDIVAPKDIRNAIGQHVYRYDISTHHE
jgi:hypothetical protein